MVHDSAETQFRDKLIKANETCEKELKGSIKGIFAQTRQNYDVDHLYKLAQLKYIIGIIAELASNYHQYASANDKDRQAINSLNENMKAILNSTIGNTKTICYYLIKDIIRKYGSACIRTISTNAQFNWITPSSVIGNDDKVTDRYVVIGANYTNVKSAVKEAITANKSEDLIEYLNQNLRNQNIFTYLCMALYREVTLLYRSMDGDKIPTQIFQKVLETKFATSRATWTQILKNTFTHNLHVKKETNVDLASILVQFKLCVEASSSRLIKPLQDLLKNPNLMRDSYLPTMPQDFIFDIQQALLEGRGHDNPKFYTCPNGHIYVLFDCGRPWVVHKCKECQADIGGTGHKLIDNNRELNVADSTMRGYCLTEAHTMSDTPIAERQLNQTSLHLTRFFLHCALYLAIDKDENAIKSMMIKTPDNAKDFFWNHLLKDLSLIVKALNINMDEVFIVIHHVLNDIMVQQRPSLHDKWNSKTDRQNWETSFNDTFLQHTLRNSSNIINRATKDMKDDCKDQVGNAELYFMAYELISETETNPNRNCPYENENFWKFRPVISFDSMAIELNKDTGQTKSFGVLKKFIEMKDKLEVVFYLPDIIKLVNILQKYLSKAIFKEYARNHTLRQCLNSSYLPRGQTTATIEHCVKQFQSAWKQSKQQLSSYITSNMPQSRFTISFDYEFSLDTNLSYFLPSKYGDGLICYALLDYLANIHNEFIEHYKISERRGNQLQQSEELHIGLFENPEFIIRFDTKGNLLRTIIANFRYDSKESKLVFSYEKVEKQIINKYVQTKSKIDIHTVPLFEYSEEMTDLAILIRLNDSIEQEPIDVFMQKSIFEEYKSVQETSEALHMLKTIINFAGTTSVKGDMKLAEFVHMIYVDSTHKNPDQILKAKVTESCQLKHLKHLWIIIAMKRAILFTLNNQDPFELLEEMFRKETKGGGSTDIKNGNDNNTISMLLVLYQLVIFFIYKISADDRSLYANYNLNLIFDGIDTDTTKILFPENMKVDDISKLFDSSFKLENIFHVWNVLAKETEKSN